MIITEHYTTRADGVNLVRTYSDEGRYLVRNDGVRYAEAIDVENSGYTYTESDQLIEPPEAEASEEPLADDAQIIE